MKATDRIFKGYKVTTAEGYILVKSYNGSIVYVSNYVSDEKDYCHFECERMLTLSEIGALMKEVDGKNHKVIWED